MKEKSETISLINSEFGAVGFIEGEITLDRLSKILRGNSFKLDAETSLEASKVLLNGREYNGMWLVSGVPIL